MKSMTAYGYGEFQNENYLMTMELKSYNNRFLEIGYFAPGYLSAWEAEISETYMLNFPITAVAISGNNIFAKSKNNGIWTASLSDNLINVNNWKQKQCGMIARGLEA